MRNGTKAWGRSVRAPWRALLFGLILLAPSARAQAPEEEARLQALNRQGIALFREGKYREAAGQFEAAVDLAAATYGPDHPNVAKFANNLAELYRSMGRYAQAEPHLRRSLKINEAARGADDPIVAIGINNLASLYLAMGRYTEAEPLYRRALAIREAKLGPDDPDVAQSVTNLAVLYDTMGRYAEAEPLYRRGLKIRETTLGPDHPDLANSLDGLAGLQAALGRTADAEALYRRALAIREAKLGPDHPDVAASLNSLASLYRSLGRYADAEPRFRRSLKIDEATLGPDHPDVAQGLNNLAVLLKLMGRYAEAEPLLRRSLAIGEAKLGPDHPMVGTFLNNLAKLDETMGRLDDAGPLYTRSLKITESALGPDHPDVATALDNLSGLYRKQGRWPEAVASTDRARRVTLRHATRVLPGLSEAEQLTFLTTQEGPSFHGALSLALLRRSDPEAAATSAGWVLNGKALAQQTLAGRALLAGDVRVPGAAPLARQLVEVRNALAALTLGRPGPGEESDRKQRLAQLAGREQELSRELGRAVGRPARDDPWVAVEEVRKALPDDAALVEIVRFRVFDFQDRGPEPKWLPPHYAAWVIPPAGRDEIRVIDLGDADAVEEAIAAVRKSLRPDMGALRARGEEEAGRDLRKPLHDLAALVLAPLLPHIGAARRWIISPDAALWLIPWAALPTADGRFAVEDHAIQHVVSGRDLVRTDGEPPATRGPALMMADPDYDLEPAQGRDAARQVLRGRAAPVAEELALRGLPDSFAVGTAPRLPGTAAEARAITPGLAAIAGAAPIVYGDRWALEDVFKAFRHPGVVVLSTHGFFRDDQEVKPDDRPGPDRPRRSAGPLPENPLLRCGLLLAGCNRRDRAGGEDGILTGLEIVGTDLRGTDLVVLSACETGLGKVHNGEGVAGLRQAFQLAGARSVVATLWQVPDRESARLMTGFFDGLAAGKGKAEALRAAQLAQIRSRRERYGAAHPFFWAAYTLTGAGN